MALFKKKQSEEASAGDRNPKWEAVLEKSFGLTFGGGAWRYDGAINSEFASQLTDPAIAVAVFKQLQKQMAFDRVCVVMGKPPFVVCNSADPLAVVTELDMNGLAGFIGAFIEGNGRQVYEYQGAWLLDLS